MPQLAWGFLLYEGEKMVIEYVNSVATNPTNPLDIY